MKLDWLTTQVAIVLSVAMLLLAGIFVGVPIWLVATNRSSPVLLSAPIGSVLVGVAAATVAWSRSVMKLPPTPDGTEWKLVPSMRAPANAVSEAELAGEDITYFGPVAGVPAEAISEADMVALSRPQPPTTPATPDSKRRYR